MNISVVMSTYNGSKYVKAQMDSILNQTKKANEVLIYDDCSSDETYDIVRNYICEHSLENWKVYRNPENYGWRKSFMNAILSATGDLIFTADQDDIWCLDKIEVMSKPFAENPQMLVLVADYQEFKFNNIPVQKQKEDSYKVEPIPCDEKWYYIRKPGCVFAFKKNIVNYMRDAWYKDYAHDVLMWQLGILMDGLYHIDYTAIFFRRHDSNATPINYHNKATRLCHANWALLETAQLKTVFDADHLLRKKTNGLYIDLYHEFTKHRINLIKNKKMTEIMWLFKHRNNYLSPKSLIIDILCTMMKK